MRIGVIFDLDGTLLDTLDDLWDGANHALAQFGCPSRTREEVRQFVGNGAELLIRRALPGRVDDPDPRVVLSAFREYYNVHCQEKTRPYPGILEALQTLAADYPLAVVSNKPDAAVKSLCRGYFGGIYALGEKADCPRKPAPDMVHKAMAAIGVERCIYVGDSEVDIATARNAQVPCLSVPWGFRDQEVLIGSGAVYFCETPAQLPEYIKKIAAGLT